MNTPQYFKTRKQAREKVKKFPDCAELKIMNVEGLGWVIHDNEYALLMQEGCFAEWRPPVDESSNAAKGIKIDLLYAKLAIAKYGRVELYKDIYLYEARKFINIPFTGYLIVMYGYAREGFTSIKTALDTFTRRTLKLKE